MDATCACLGCSVLGYDMIHERDAFSSNLSYVLNIAFFPLKMIIPQPVVGRLPGLVTNFDIRTNLVLAQCEGRLLDIGCGENQLVQRYRLRGKTGIGTDIHDWGNVDLLVADTADLPLETGSFDTVTFVACINHIPNRREVLREARRLLSPNGKIVITNLTPTVSKIWHKWAFWDADQHERGMKEGEVYGFTDRNLRELLKEAGFRVTAHSRFSWGLNNIYVANRE
jgi:SAM-dependent methyltransferase